MFQGLWFNLTWNTCLFTRNYFDYCASTFFQQSRETCKVQTLKNLDVSISILSNIALQLYFVFQDCVETEIKVQVCVFLFDLLYLNGESLVQKPLIERRRLLRENFKTVEEQFVFATSIDSTTMEEMQEFLDESVKGECRRVFPVCIKVSSLWAFWE